MKKIYTEDFPDTDNVQIEVNVAGAVIIRKNSETKTSELLLIQRSKDDMWPLRFEFPRGKCDGGYGKIDEKLIPCLKREVKEESGLDVKPIKFIDKFKYIADNGKRETIQYNFLCRMVDPNQEVVLSKEHQNFKWVKTMAEVQLLIPTKEIVTTISKVFNDAGELVNYPEKQLSIEEQIERYLNSL